MWTRLHKTTENRSIPGINSIKKSQVYFTSRTLVSPLIFNTKFEFNTGLIRRSSGYKPPTCTYNCILLSSIFFKPNFICAFYICKKKTHLYFIYWIDPCPHFLKNVLSALLSDARKPVRANACVRTELSGEYTNTEIFFLDKFACRYFGGYTGYNMFTERNHCHWG